ncbi:hypothetical protein BN1097_400001 [Clostridioides difficile]|uniref:Uncharacterized protein n=1 Tax=Clostridioides difficile TaxID=1496 RepID=A0A069A2S7_CLODI|nr:hypothetical protein BN1097_400001 [Clostridioides difficile]
MYMILLLLFTICTFYIIKLLLFIINLNNLHYKKLCHISYVY